MEHPMEQRMNVKFCVRICYLEGPEELCGAKIKWDTSATGLCCYADDVKLLEGNIDTIKKNTNFMELSTYSKAANCAATFELPSNLW
jgi:hypothetical protein